MPTGAWNPGQRAALPTSSPEAETLRTSASSVKCLVVSFCFAGSATRIATCREWGTQFYIRKISTNCEPPYGIEP
jgi:hypothetical protein